MITIAERDQLENQIDRLGLKAVLQLITDVCAAKCEHVSANWQDKPLSNAWARAARAVERTAHQPDIEALP